MSISVEFQLEGFNQLSRRLRALGERVGGKVLRQSVSSAVNPVVKEVRAAAPVGKRAHKTFKGRLVAPGFLSRSIRKRTWKSRDGRRASASIGVASEAFYGLQFVELGTKRLPAKPWLEPIFDQKKQEVTNKLKADLLAKIERARRQ